MENRHKRSAWLVALWAIIPLVIALVSIPFIAVAIVSFEWSLVASVFRTWWLAFLIIIIMTYGLILAFTAYPLGTISTVLLSLGFLFALASPQENTLAQELRSMIGNNLVLEYLVASITVLAFLIAFYGIYKQETRRNRNG